MKGIPYIIEDSAQKPQVFQGPPLAERENALRQHAKEVIVTKADEALARYEEMLRAARAKHDEAMVRHWTRRIEERKRMIERLKR